MEFLITIAAYLYWPRTLLTPSQQCQSADGNSAAWEMTHWTSPTTRLQTLRAGSVTPIHHECSTQRTAVDRVLGVCVTGSFGRDHHTELQHDRVSADYRLI